MKTCLAVVALLATSLGCSRVVSAVKGYTANGQDAIQAAYRSKAAAKSFTMVTRVAAHDDNVMETHFYVSCPDKERITLKMGATTRQMVRFGKRFYINEDGTWYYKDVAVDNWSPCGENPGLPSPWALLTEGRDLLTVFASAKDKFKVEWADQVNYKGQNLDRWTVAMNHASGGSSGFKYTVILDKEKRPLLIGLGQSSVTEYSDWNQPLTIDVPSGAVPYPENTSVADPTPKLLVPGHRR